MESLKLGNTLNNFIKKSGKTYRMMILAPFQLCFFEKNLNKKNPQPINAMKCNGFGNNSNKYMKEIPARKQLQAFTEFEKPAFNSSPRPTSKKRNT